MQMSKYRKIRIIQKFHNSKKVKIQCNEIKHSQNYYQFLVLSQQKSENQINYNKNYNQNSINLPKDRKSNQFTGQISIHCERRYASKIQLVLKMSGICRHKKVFGKRHNSWIW